MNTTAKLLLLPAVGLCLLGCNRAVDSASTKISIQLPSLGASKVATGKPPLSKAIISNDGKIVNDWASITPNGISSISCYMVTVSGPESGYNKNRCGRKSTSVNTVNGLTTDISFGSFLGVTPAGQTLELDVPSGSDRVFTLIGFQLIETSSVADACANINSTNFDKSKLSKPFILGQSASTELKPTAGNEFVSIPISMTFNERSYLDDCEGQDFTAFDNRSPVKVSLKKTMFPEEAAIGGACTPVDVQILDSKGRMTISRSNTSLKIVNPVGETISTYPTFTNCNGHTGLADSFIIESNTSTTQRWYRANATVGSSDFLRIDPSSSSLVNENSNTSLHIPNFLPTKIKLQVIGPTVVAADVCYKYEIAFRALSGVGYSPDPMTSVYVATPDQTELYTDMNCTLNAARVRDDQNGIPHGFEFRMTGLTSEAKKVFFAKFAASSAHKNLMSAYDSAFNGVNLPGTLNYFVATTNDYTPVATIIRENDVKLSTAINSCFGPFRLSLINSSGVEVPADSGTGYYNFTVTGTANGAKVVANCGASPLSSVTIGAGNSASVFYISTTTPTASAPNFVFNDTGNRTGFNSIFNFSLN